VTVDAGARPRILLVPTLTELEWANRPLLEEWAEVASYDGPAVGTEPPATGLRTPATAERGLTEIDRLGWGRCVVVGDEFGALAAVMLAAARPAAVEGLVLGHPVASFSRTGDRPAVSPGVTAALAQLAEVDFRAFIRQEARAWHEVRNAAAADAASPDELAERYLERVPHATATEFYRELIAHEHELMARVGAALRSVEVPLLLVKHEGCLMYTTEGYEDAVAAFPGAARASTSAKPSVDPAFAEILREFCEQTAREPAPAPG
jgi:pimeloyl-ACP methyl ester carboxylesterase